MAMKIGAIILIVGIALAIGGFVAIWDKWKKDCERDGVCKFDGQENGKNEESY